MYTVSLFDLNEIESDRGADSVGIKIAFNLEFESSYCVANILYGWVLGGIALKSSIR